MALPGAAADASAETPSQRELFGLSDDTASGTQWQGSKYVASTKTFTKWWPAIYPGEWQLPNGMRYPFVWKIKTIRVEGSRVEEAWTWEWVETPGMPSIAEVEDMLRAHYEQQKAAKQQEQNQQQSAAPAAAA